MLTGILLLLKHRISSVVCSIFQPPSCSPQEEKINWECALLCKQKYAVFTFYFTTEGGADRRGPSLIGGDLQFIATPRLLTFYLIAPIPSSRLGIILGAQV